MKLGEPYSKYFETNLYKKIEDLNERYENCSNADECKQIVGNLDYYVEKFLHAVNSLEKKCD